MRPPGPRSIWTAGDIANTIALSVCTDTPQLTCPSGHLVGNLRPSDGFTTSGGQLLAHTYPLCPDPQKWPAGARSWRNMVSRSARCGDRRKFGVQSRAVFSRLLPPVVAGVSGAILSRPVVGHRTFDAKEPPVVIGDDEEERWQLPGHALLRPIFAAAVSSGSGSSEQQPRMSSPNTTSATA
jgi:hypothetical protein